MSIVMPVDETGYRNSATTHVTSDMNDNVNNIVENDKKIVMNAYKRRYVK